jgi:predicted DNA-binding transcriptional regulator YafY
MKGLLLNARENKTPLIMIYMDDKGTITERFITVKDFDDDYIKAYCHWKKQYRTFKRCNILSIGPVRQRRVGA